MTSKSVLSVAYMEMQNSRAANRRVKDYDGSDSGDESTAQQQTTTWSVFNAVASRQGGRRSDDKFPPRIIPSHRGLPTLSVADANRAYFLISRLSNVFIHVQFYVHEWMIIMSIAKTVFYVGWHDGVMLLKTTEPHEIRNGCAIVWIGCQLSE